MQFREMTIDSKSMSHEDDYRLDVAGYLIVRNVLNAEEVGACNRALDETAETVGMLEWEEPWRDPFVKLRDHPALTQILDQLCWGDVRLDAPPRLIEQRPEVACRPLVGGNEPRNWSRAYQHVNKTRYLHGVLVIWALSDVNEGDGGFVLIPGSHRSDLIVPADIRDGSDDMGLVEQPALGAGDLLLCAQTLLHGVRPWKAEPKRLLSYGYIGGLVRRSDNAIEEGEKATWVDEMTPEQRVVLSIDTNRSVVKSDGKATSIEEDAEGFHPSIHVRDPDSEIDEKELYFWDLCGYLVLRGLMDESWVTAANEAIDRFSDRLEYENDATRGSKRLAGTPLPSLHGLFDLPHPYCDPFREMIAHPAVIQRLNWMMGSGYYLRRARGIHYDRGTSGLFLHSTPEPATPRNRYALQNGRCYSEQVNATWQLCDVKAGDGGYVCIPGSHKANHPIPERLALCEEEMDEVRHVEMETGDVLLFMGAAQTHGAYPWMNEKPRRGVILTYISKNLDLMFQR